MAACLYCGIKIESDCLIWKGGASQAICEKCEKEENKILHIIPSYSCCRSGKYIGESRF